MSYAKLSVITEQSWLSPFFKTKDNYIYQNMPDLDIYHELQGDAGSWTSPAWEEMSIEKIEIRNKTDYTDNQIEIINDVLDDVWLSIAEEYECELGENWNDYINNYYGY